jgi:hypothetical protein
MKINIPIIIFVLLVVVMVTITSIEVDLPPELQGQFEVTGKIDSCDISGLRGGKLFVGIKLEDESVPILRLNTYRATRSTFEEICEQKKTISAKYHAIKRVWGSVIYWVDLPLNQNIKFH